MDTKDYLVDNNKAALTNTSDRKRMEAAPSLTQRKPIPEAPSTHFAATVYLPIKLLSERIGYAVKTIYNLVSKGTFQEGVHYFKPTKRKLLFYWPAIEKWIREEHNG